MKIFTRCEFHLFQFYISTIKEQTIIDWIAYGSNQKCIDYLSLKLSETFEDYIDERIANTQDNWFRLLCNFVKVTKHAVLMRESIRNGYSIGMELLYNKFINVWAAVKKPKCMENIFATTEDFYFKSPSWLLEVIRQNRFAKLYNDKRPDGSETSERAMDDNDDTRDCSFGKTLFPSVIMLFGVGKSALISDVGQSLLSSFLLFLFL